MRVLYNILDFSLNYSVLKYMVCLMTRRRKRIWEFTRYSFVTWRAAKSSLFLFPRKPARFVLYFWIKRSFVISFFNGGKGRRGKWSLALFQRAKQLGREFFHLIFRALLIQIIFHGTVQKRNWITETFCVTITEDFPIWNYVTNAKS